MQLVRLGSPTVLLLLLVLLVDQTVVLRSWAWLTQRKPILLLST
jgi:hypothetical protein